jgi:hypothetical protein
VEVGGIKDAWIESGLTKAYLCLIAEKFTHYRGMRIRIKKMISVTSIVLRALGKFMIKLR